MDLRSFSKSLALISFFPTAIVIDGGHLMRKSHWWPNGLFCHFFLEFFHGKDFLASFPFEVRYHSKKFHGQRLGCGKWHLNYCRLGPCRLCDNKHITDCVSHSYPIYIAPPPAATKGLWDVPRFDVCLGLTRTSFINMRNVMERFFHRAIWFRWTWKRSANSERVCCSLIASNATLALNAEPWFFLFPFAIFTAPSIFLSLEQLLHLSQCPFFLDP